MINKFNVGVVLPIYNAKATLSRSLLSVLSQKNIPENVEQLYVICVLNACDENDAKEYEAIINSSIPKDKDDKIIISMVTEPEKGIVPALNAGLQKALKYGCLWIARQDSDDFWYETKLQKQLDFLMNNPEISILGTGIRYVSKSFEPEEILMYPEKDEEIKNHLLNGRNAIAHPSVIFRSNILKFYSYDDSFPMAEDLFLWTRCVKKFKFANLQEVLIDYTRNPNPAYNPLCPLIIASNAQLALRYFT